ncbi:hypothetical protein [Streptomyces sp. NPDC012888]|uniref:hypothetical protein n=1 Tax=Streptomyces sp. NPDC012888 TaxID=3364855 RepID=UPI003695396D
MYLVHAQLAPPPDGQATGEAMRQVRDALLQDREVQHIACHPDGPGGPVLGVFTLAGSVEEAEDRVAALCRAALRHGPGLRGWRLGRCEVVLALPGGRPGAEGPAAMA